MLENNNINYGLQKQEIMQRLNEEKISFKEEVKQPNNNQYSGIISNERKVLRLDI